MISFHTNAFLWSGCSDIGRIIGFAKDTGFDAIELGPGFPLDKEALSSIKRSIPVSALIYCRNFIDDDEETAEREKKELWKRMEAASELESRKMIISTGISRSLSLPEEGGCNPLLSLNKVLDFLSEAVGRAKELGLVLLLENCPMYRNIATSPYMWREIFSSLPDFALGLCYDPAHFVWQMIDPYKPAEDFRDRIHHVHMKNTVIDRSKLNDVGILHNTA
ncbi:MAG: sugar phosphate isomerase/epimerase family protein, partial [Candidatus Ornithospirochaeta sp.]